MSGFLDEIDDFATAEPPPVKKSTYKPPRTFLDEIDAFGVDEQADEERRRKWAGYGKRDMLAPGANQVDPLAKVRNPAETGRERTDRLTGRRNVQGALTHLPRPGAPELGPTGADFDLAQAEARYKDVRDQNAWERDKDVRTSVKDIPTDLYGGRSENQEARFRADQSAQLKVLADYAAGRDIVEKPPERTYGSKTVKEFGGQLLSGLLRGDVAAAGAMAGLQAPTNLVRELATGEVDVGKIKEQPGVIGGAHKAVYGEMERPGISRLFLDPAEPGSLREQGALAATDILTDPANIVPGGALARAGKMAGMGEDLARGLGGAFGGPFGEGGAAPPGVRSDSPFIGHVQREEPSPMRPPTREEAAAYGAEADARLTAEANRGYPETPINQAGQTVEQATAARMALERDTARQAAEQARQRNEVPPAVERGPEAAEAQQAQLAEAYLNDRLQQGTAGLGDDLAAQQEAAPALPTVRPPGQEAADALAALNEARRKAQQEGMVISADEAGRPMRVEGRVLRAPMPWEAPVEAKPRAKAAPKEPPGPPEPRLEKPAPSPEPPPAAAKLPWEGAAAPETIVKVQPSGGGAMGGPTSRATAQRGAALTGAINLPGLAARLAGKAVQGFVDVVSKVTREMPELMKFEFEPGFFVQTRLLQLRRQETSMTGTSRDIGNAAYKGVSKAERADGLAVYPTLRSMKKRALAGQKQNLPLAEIDARLAAIEAKFGKPRTDALMKQIREQASLPLYEAGVSMGRLKPLPPPGPARDAILDDYVHHHVKAYNEGKSLPGPIGRPPGERFVGSFMKARGSEKAIEMDAYLAIQKQAHDVLTAVQRHAFIQEMKKQFDLTDVARDGELVAEDLALYNFGEKGGAQLVEKQPQEVADKIKHALEKEKIDPKTGERYRMVEYFERYDDGSASPVQMYREDVKPGDPLKIQTGFDKAGHPTFEEAYVLPRDLADGLVNANAPFRLPRVLSAITNVANKAKALILANNVQYNTRQMLFDDPGTMFMNLSPEQWPQAAWYYAARIKELQAEVRKTLDGERSPMLDDVRTKGLWGGHFVDFLTEEGGINPNELPFKYKDLKGQAGHVASEILLPNETLTNIREAALKMTYQEMGKRLGLSERQALRFAHERAGNYWEASPLERYAAPMTMFTKFHTTALGRMTMRILEDPATGRVAKDPAGLLRMLRTTPALKVAIGAAVLSAWNDRQDPELAKELREAGYYASQPALLWKRENGKWATLGSLQGGGYSAIFDGVMSAIEETLAGRPEVAARDLAEAVGQRAAPTFLLPELAAGRTMSGRDVPSERELKMGSAAQRRVNAQEKGLPLTSRQVYALERALPTPTRYWERAKGEAPEDPLDFWRMFGSPLGTVDSPAIAEGEKFSKGRALYDEFASIVLSPVQTPVQSARLDALVDWAAKHDLLDRWSADLSAGAAEEDMRLQTTPDERRAMRRIRFPQ